MSNKASKNQVALGLFLLISITAIAFWAIAAIWNWFSSLNSDLAVGMLTASSTIIVATITLVLGKYYERAKEAESHFRQRKIEIYDEFLKRFLLLFFDEKKGDEDLVPFLQEWQRKLIVWGGPNVLAAFITWKQHLAAGNPDARTVFLMDEFFKAMRADIGLSNRGLGKGFFSTVILRNADIFLAAAKANPGISLAEIAKLEENLERK